MGSGALFAALELELFESVERLTTAGTGPTAAAIMEDVGVAAPRMQTLLNALTAMHALRLADGRYTLSPNSAKHLLRSSRGYYGDYIRFQVGRQFAPRMAQLPTAFKAGESTLDGYASWFSSPAEARMYTEAQHNGSTATAKAMLRSIDLSGAGALLDVGGGSGAFSYVFAAAYPGLNSTVLELPEVCRTGEAISAQQPADVHRRVSFVELDVTASAWPTPDAEFDVVLMSYISGSIPEPALLELYRNAYVALRPGGLAIVHDFMVDDSLAGPKLAALWALQHVAVNPGGLGLSPSNVAAKLEHAGFAAVANAEMIGGMTKMITARKR